MHDFKVQYICTPAVNMLNNENNCLYYDHSFSAPKYLVILTLRRC